MTQTRTQSLIEVIASTIVGCGVAMATQAVIFPWFSISVTHGESALIALIFTAVSILRAYIFRRVFNKISRLTFFQ